MKPGVLVDIENSVVKACGHSCGFEDLFILEILCFSLDHVDRLDITVFLAHIALNCVLCTGQRRKKYPQNCVRRNEVTVF